MTIVPAPSPIPVLAGLGGQMLGTASEVRRTAAELGFAPVSSPTGTRSVQPPGGLSARGGILDVLV